MSGVIFTCCDPNRPLLASTSRSVQIYSAGAEHMLSGSALPIDLARARCLAAVGFEERLEPLLHVTLKIKSVHAQKHMTADLVVFLVIDRPVFQGHSLEIAKRLLDHAQVFVSSHNFLMSHVRLRDIGGNDIAAIKKFLLMRASSKCHLNCTLRTFHSTNLPIL